MFSNLIPGTEYDFIARVKETPVRRASDVSAPLTVTLEQDAQDPVWAVDSALSASSVGPSHVTLAWTGATDNAAIASYKVYKDGVPIGAPATASYTVTGLKPVTSYEFKVEACDVVGRWAAGGPELTISTEPGPEEEEEKEEPPAWLGADHLTCLSLVPRAYSVRKAAPSSWRPPTSARLSYRPTCWQARSTRDPLRSA